MRLKRLATSWAQEKKRRKYVTAPRGPHPLKSSLPLLMIIRDMLGFAETAREARAAIKGRKVLVDKRICSDPRFGVGMMDVVEAGGRQFRALPKPKLRLVEAPAAEANRKVCKITGKKVVKGGRLQVNLHDGRNMIIEGNEYRTNDSLLLELPGQKIIEHLKFEPGATVMVMSGRNAGALAKVGSIEKGLYSRAWLESEGRKFEAPVRNIMVIGRDKPVIATGD